MADYAALGLSLKAHPVAFFREELRARRILTSAEHWDERLAGRRVTVAGLVLHQLSRVPNEGEILQLGRFEVEVVDMDDRRIDKLIFKQVVNAEDEKKAVAEHYEG